MNKQPTSYKPLITLSIALIGSSIMLVNLSAHAMSPEEACKKPRYNIWKEMQTERLWTPDEETLSAEKSGKIFTYHCFTRDQVNQFYDTQPDRIESAHFHPVLEENSENNTLASVADDDC